MKIYTLMRNSEIVKDEDGDDVRFKAASRDDKIVIWMEQKCGELNNFRKGPHWVKVEQLNA